MKIVTKANFVHGQRPFRKGETVDVAEALARQLIGAGLAREAAKADEKTAPKVSATPAAKPAAKPAAAPAKAEGKE